MFKLLGAILKTGFFALAVLVAGQLIHWNGRTVSDQVRTGMAHAETTAVVRSLKSKTISAWDSLRQRVQGAFSSAFSGAGESVSQKAREAKSRTEKRVKDLLDSERQELEELLKKPELKNQ